MNKKIICSVNEGINAIKQLQLSSSVLFIEDVAQLIATAFKTGKKVIIAGNGGSLCDAMHFAEELTGFFREKRPALPALALSDPGHVTCVGNDMGFEKIFARGVEAFGKPEDVFIGLTTSGNSQNIIDAFSLSKQMGLKTVAFLGKEGGKLKGVADLEIIIRGFKTSDRIQEAHMAAIHIIIEMVEDLLFPENKALSTPLSQEQEKVLAS